MILRGANALNVKHPLRDLSGCNHFFSRLAGSAREAIGTANSTVPALDLRALREQQATVDVDIGPSDKGRIIGRQIDCQFCYFL